MYRRGSEAEVNFDPDNPYQHGNEAEAKGYFPRNFAVAVLQAVNLAAHAVCMRPDCESPIEVMLGAQLAADLNYVAPGRWTIVPQYQLQRFRFDFAVFRTDDRERPVLLIECDGREFHSTLEQLRRDASKTDFCLAHGFPLLRFTGSEIYRDQRFCAEQCLACLEAI